MKNGKLENLFVGIMSACVLGCAILVLTALGMLTFQIYHPKTVHAQSGTTCCKIDPVIISTDDQGNLVVYHAKGPLTLPAGSTTVYTGTSLSQALTISEDTLYAVKGSQQ